MILENAGDGFRMLGRSIRVKFSGFRRFTGSAWEIADDIVKQNWNGRYFTTSTGHFRQFYSRDFGMCASSLKGLGYEKEVIKTLDYALARFSAAGRTGTHIGTSGKVLNFPSWTPESLSYVIHAMKVADSDALLEKYRGFLEKESEKVAKAIEQDTGLVRRNRNYSTMKDHAVRNSPAYLNAVIGMLSHDLDFLGLQNPLKDYNYERVLLDNFWNGSYFFDDLSGKEYVAGDANVFPFWTGTVKSRSKLKKSLEAVRSEGLDRPYPLKYTAQKIRGGYLRLPSMLAPNYEGNTVWLHLGSCFVETLDRFRIKETAYYLGRFEELITQHGTFPEVLNPDGSPYKSMFYYCDEGMLWGSIPLRIQKTMEGKSRGVKKITASGRN